MSETNKTQAEPTEKELLEYRENMKKFYDQQIPLLRKQKEYEGLLADIEEARAKRFTMSMRIAQIMAGPPEPPSQEEQDAMREQMQQEMLKEEEQSKEKKPRQLKKEGA